jgi:hypothetical protein
LCISPIYPSALNAIGRPGVVFVNSIIEAAIMVAGLLVGVAYGLKGVCMAWLCFYPVAFIIISHRSLGTLGIGLTELITRLKFPFFASLAMSLAVLTAERVLESSVNVPALLLLSTFLGAVVFTILVITFKREMLMKLKVACFAGRRGSDV